MNLNYILSLGTRCFALSCTVLNVATCPSAAQLQPDFSFLHVDPLDGFEELTIETISPIATTFEACLENPNATFMISKRGGLADDPTQTLRDRTLWQDLRPLHDSESLEPTIDESRTVNVEMSQLENSDEFNLQKCQALFDNQ